MPQVAQEERFENFVGLIGALNKEIMRIKTVEGARLGLKASDVMCLYYLERSPEGLTGAELARITQVDRAAVSRTLARLEQEGLVEVVSGVDAKYRAPVRLTERGRQTTATVDAIVDRVLDEVEGALDEDERRQMYASLEAVLAKLKTISTE